MAKRKKKKVSSIRKRRRRLREAFSMQEKSAGNFHVGVRTPIRSHWASESGSLSTFLRNESEKTLDAYRSQPNLVLEHANLEADTSRGGYANRQVIELVQNSADALAISGSGRILLRLTATHLYCADEGVCIDQDGARALMFSHISSKRGPNIIGKFGLGFKSVLGVSDSPEFFSKTASFRFDRTESSERITSATGKHESTFPTLRLAKAIDPWPELKKDQILAEMMRWASNIVRLPLNVGAAEKIAAQLASFPAQFLLFAPHVTKLVMFDNVRDTSREFKLTRNRLHWSLYDDGKVSRWILAKKLHRLSELAKQDNRPTDEAEEVPISWAAPLDNLNEPGNFWAFFPTLTPCLLSGILNAPWKTNEDRQNLLPGAYNDELIDASATLVANTIRRLATNEDPARHLDALPRREEGGDADHSIRLRRALFNQLCARKLVPDQSGQLQFVGSIKYPPRELTVGSPLNLRPFEIWAEYSGPSDWLHHSAITPIRLARIERLFQVHAGKRFGTESRDLPRATIPVWLESLVDCEESTSARDEPDQAEDADSSTNGTLGSPAVARVTARAIESSIAAIRTAAAIPQYVRNRSGIGRILLCANGRWVEPHPDEIQLHGAVDISPNELVHPGIEDDEEAVRCLRELGVRSVTLESAFAKYVKQMFEEGIAGISTPNAPTETANNGVWQSAPPQWVRFWQLARGLNAQSAANAIKSQADWRLRIRIRTLSGVWMPLTRVLLPGPIVPKDGSRDSMVTVDVEFHSEDFELFELIGVADRPQVDFPIEGKRLRRLIANYRWKFTQRDLPQNPVRNRLNFTRTLTSGPLDVLADLSDLGKCEYTRRLLDLPSTYSTWQMKHDTQEHYPMLDCESPAISEIREHGRVELGVGTAKVSDALGDPPKSQAALFWLLSHKQRELICESFGIADAESNLVEPIDADEPLPVVDIWPGLKRYIPKRFANLQLVRCEQIRIFGPTGIVRFTECTASGDFVYILRGFDESEELELILNELDLWRLRDSIPEIIQLQTPDETRKSRDEIRRCQSDEERLLLAVGGEDLKAKLPNGLIEILDQPPGSLTGTKIAKAAIAMYHAGALREYRDSLIHLDPPKKWAGSPRAIEFVTSLGFGRSLGRCEEYPSRTIPRGRWTIIIASPPPISKENRVECPTIAKG